MNIKGLKDEDFINYKKPSMFVGFPHCSWKCEKECGQQVCQNSALADTESKNIGIKTLLNRYINNPITSAIVCGGLEPFDDWDDLYQLVSYFREVTQDDIVIYTGYYKKEIEEYIDKLNTFQNIIIKYGRFIPGHKKHYDDVLGVYLASDNQYAERLNKINVE